MDNRKNELVSSLRSTAVLVTNQFQCERLIQAGRSVADISKTDLIVLNVQSNEYPANPEAIQYLFNIATQNNALMNVKYAEDSFKTIVKYIKDNKTAYVVTGMPQTKNSILHRIWRKFAHVTFFTVDEAGTLHEVTDKSVYQKTACHQPFWKGAFP